MNLQNASLEQLNAFNKHTIIEHLDIEITEVTSDTLKGRMPVNHKTHQPMGLLHGGASVVLIESLGSIGSSVLVDLNQEYPVGIEVNANHVGGVKSGYVTAEAKLVHKGKKTHVWQVEVYEEETRRLVSTGRLTVMIVKK